MLFLFITLLFFNSALADCPSGGINVPPTFGSNWSCLLFDSAVSPFASAEVECINKGGHLVSIPNGFFNIFVAQTADQAFGDGNSTAKFWIGVTDLFGNGWQNIDDGSPISYTDWAPGEPNNSTSQGGCVSMDLLGYWYNDNCSSIYPFGCEFNEINASSTVVIPTTTPSTSPTSTEAVTTEPTSVIAANTSAQVSTTTRAPAIPAFLCKSHLAFAVDVSLALSADQYNSMINMILDPFLSVIYPIDIKPAPWVYYSEAAYNLKAAKNVSDIVKGIKIIEQGTSTRGFINKVFPLLTTNGALSYDDTLPKNTIVFTGTGLTGPEIVDTQNNVNNFTENGSTVTVVLMKDGVDLTNYNQITNLNIVNWDADQAYIISDLEKVLNCQN